jgi:hypothetical protein
MHLFCICKWIPKPLRSSSPDPPGSVTNSLAGYVIRIYGSADPDPQIFTDPERWLADALKSAFSECDIWEVR